jgi:hypothetical protein
MNREDLIDQAEDEWFEANAAAHAAWNKLAMLQKGWSKGSAERLSKPVGQSPEEGIPIPKPRMSQAEYSRLLQSGLDYYTKQRTKS